MPKFQTAAPDQHINSIVADKPVGLKVDESHEELSSENFGAWLTQKKSLWRENRKRHRPRTMANMKRREVREYARCEELYSGLFEKWRALVVYYAWRGDIKKYNIGALKKILGEVSPVVQDISSSFFIKENAPGLLKQTRDLLMEKDGAYLDDYEILKKQFLFQYQVTVNRDLPVDFNPQRWKLAKEFGRRKRPCNKISPHEAKGS